MRKGELMELVYEKDELSNIDSAIPMDRWEEFPPSQHVMNYNDSIFGEIENLIQVGLSRGIIEYCDDCDYGVQWVSTGSDCHKPTSNCCGACGYDQVCDTCEGSSIIVVV